MGVRIPRKQGVSPARVSGVMLSGQTMGAGANAMGNISKVIEGIGKDAFGHQVQLARIDNAKKISEKKRQMREGVADFQNKLMQDKSIPPSEWSGRLAKHINGLNIGSSELSPEAQDQWSSWSADYGSQQSLRVARDATLASINEAKLATQNNMASYEQNKDFSASRGEVDDNDWMTPEQKKAAHLDIDKREKSSMEKDLHEQIETDIIKNPFGINVDDKELYPELSDYQREIYKKKIDRAQHNANSQRMDEVIDDIYSDQIPSETDFESKLDGLGGKAQRYLIDTYRRYQEDKLNPEHLTDEQRKQKHYLSIGAAERALSEYDPTGEAKDYGYAKAMGMISQVENKDLRAELVNGLKAKREGVELEIKNKWDWGFKQIDEHMDEVNASDVIEKPKGKSLGQYREEGFLNDFSMLRQAGWDEETAREISDLAKKGEHSKAEKLLRGTYDSSNQREDYFPDKNLQVLEAIRDGKSATTMLVTGADQSGYEKRLQSQRDSQDARRGSFKAQLMDFKKANPDATRSELESFLNKVNVNIEAGSTDDTWEERTGTSYLLPSGENEPSGDMDLLPMEGTSSIPANRGIMKDGWAVGKASTYGFKGDKFEDNHKYGGMTSVGLKRGSEPWWKDEGKPTIALAPETAKSMGLSLPSKKSGKWDTSNSSVTVELPNGKQIEAVYAENGMNNPKYPNSHNKLIDFSEQFQSIAGIKGGDTLEGIKIRPSQ